MSIELIRRPQGMGEPLGRYSHISIVRDADLVYIAGQAGLLESGELAGDGGFADQVRQTFTNIVTALEAVGAGPADLVKTSTFIVAGQDIEVFMKARADVFSGMFPDAKYPPNTILYVSRLVQERLLIEIEAIAALERPQ